MLLTTNHLAVLDQFDGREAGDRQAHPAARHDAALYRALEQAGLVEPVRGDEYCLTAEGRTAQRLLDGMEAAGLLPARRVLAPDWHFIDDEVLVALEAAEPGSDRVAFPAASMLLTRGLASLYDEPDELRAVIALNAFGKSWRELANRSNAPADDRRAWNRPSTPRDDEVEGGAETSLA